MSEMRIEKVWSDSDAAYHYELQKFSPKSNDHSCYGCYDDWAFSRRKCHNNEDTWVTKHVGNKKWAEAIAKHHKLELPK